MKGGGADLVHDISFLIQGDRDIKLSLGYLRIEVFFAAYLFIDSLSSF